MDVIRMDVRENDNEQYSTIMKDLPSVHSLFGRESFSQEVAQLLLGMGMEKYIEIFKANKVSLEVFLALTVEDLKVLGIEDPVDCETIIQNAHLGRNNKPELKTTVSQNIVSRATDDMVIAKHLLSHCKDMSANLSILLRKLNNSTLSDYYLSKDFSAKKLLKITNEKAIQQTQINLNLIHDKSGDGLIEKNLLVDKIELPLPLKRRLKGTRVVRKKRLALSILAATGLCSLAIFIHSNFQ